MTETDGEERALQVPEGLGGERVDVALARMFGISRSKAAELVARRPGARGRSVGHEVRPPHPRGPAGGRLPLRGRPAGGGGRGRRGHPDHPRRRRDRGDRQAGRGRRAPLDGLDRSHRRRPPARCRLPDRHERRPGTPRHRAAPRRRYVGGDGDRQERARLLAAEERLPAPQGRQDLPRAGPGASRPARGHHRRSDRPAHEAPTGSSRSATTASTASPTTRRSRPTGSRASSRSTSRPGGPTRSGCTWRR